MWSFPGLAQCSDANIGHIVQYSSAVELYSSYTYNYIFLKTQQKCLAKYLQTITKRPAGWKRLRVEEREDHINVELMT